MGNLWQDAVGIIVLVVVVAGLLFLYYSRTNAVEKTGYGALAMLALVSIMIPVFWIMLGTNQAEAKAKQFNDSTQRGMVVYAQNCTDQCYGVDEKGKLTDITYNGYPLNELNQFISSELRRVISAGVYNPKAIHQPANPNAIPKSDQFGGGLLSNDIDDLMNFIRSADPDYLKQNGYPTHNKFDDLVSYLQLNAPTQLQAAQTFAKNGQFGEPKDMTSASEVTIDIVDPGKEGANCPSTDGCFTPINMKVKVGTKITWVNKSTKAHTVVATNGQNLAKPTEAAQIFDSNSSYSGGLIQTGQTFTYTVTADAYNLDATNHKLVYYCSIHPAMLGQFVIVQ